jgi:hypothetical protein
MRKEVILELREVKSKVGSFPPACHLLNVLSMSELGQTQKSECATGKSALPSTTGIVSQTCQVPNPSSKTFASFKSGASKPSVNKP